MTTLWVLLGLLAWTALATAIGVLVGRGIDRRDAGAETSAAWDNGFLHGVRIAHGAVLNYRKPWITLGEERGWDLARGQLTSELFHLLDEALPNETNPTARQASVRGVSS